jgi:hypothetical protein
MPSTWTRKYLGKEDITFHDPASGTAAQTFARPASNPSDPDVDVTKLSAQDIPLRDAVVVTGAATPFEALADTQVAKNVETALADIRKNIPHYRNVEHYGMVPNDSTASVAEKNRAVWNQIISDLSNAGVGDGIFVPSFYYVKDDGTGGEILDGNGLPNITLTGAGPGSSLIGQAASTAGYPLLRWDDGYGLRISDITLNRNGAGAECFRMASSATQLNSVRLLGCQFSSGSTNVLIDGSGLTTDTDFWISRCIFGNAASYNINIDGCSDTHITDNTFTGTGIGVVHSGTGAANAMRNVLIQGNILKTAGMDILVSRSGVYTAANHKGVSIIDNRLEQGQVAVINMNRVLCQLNKLYAGGIQITFNTMTTAQGLQLIANEITGRTGSGISITGASTTIEGFEILGGSISNCTQSGILVQTSGAPAKWGRIQGVGIFNCSREDAATEYSGIHFNPADAAGGVMESVVVDNVIRCTAATAGGNLPLYGVQEAAGGVSNKNMIGPNFIQGYSTADVLISGAASLDVVAAVTASVATYARFDGGGAV